MLVVGTFDVMLFLSIVVGAGVGYFLSDPLCTWYSSIKYRDSENEYQRNENNDCRPINRLTQRITASREKGQWIYNEVQMGETEVLEDKSLDEK